ncbi:MAG: dTDP-4-amino-4,6-dideoxygalactose transaminase [Candidatus Daviesbacteria bacterium]|nr:dTDP-4-amino-4,6-dideoxygalactose transaminase [Candidatus Daviesbacteria bacterium]
MIPLHKPFLEEDDKKVLLETIDSGVIYSGGSVENSFLRELKDYFGVEYAIAVPSGTAALELAVASLNLKQDDEVIVPSFTFPSDATAILNQGATVKFAEIDPVYFNIDPESIKKQLSPKTKAIIAVHYAGMSCQMDQIMQIAKKAGIKIIEDASHGWGSRYKGKLLGTIGDIGCFSLHATKNITSGEGGIFITNSKKIFRKAEIYRQVGTNRYDFLQKKIRKYQWVSRGSSYYLSGLQSAIARNQLKKINKITQDRKNIAQLYLEFLGGIKEVVLPQLPSECDPNWHIFAILVSSRKRDQLIEFMKSKDIETAFHYTPLHSSKMGRKLGYKKSDFKITNTVADSILRLPIYPGLKESDIKFIASKFKKFFKNLTK